MTDIQVRVLDLTTMHERWSLPDDAVAFVTAALAAAITDALIFKGTITLPADFPAPGDVEEGYTYRILAPVIDNDATKTNTGQEFTQGDEIAWNGTDWSKLGSVLSDRVATVGAGAAGMYNNIHEAVEAGYTDILLVSAGALDWDMSANTFPTGTAIRVRGLGAAASTINVTGSAAIPAAATVRINIEDATVAFGANVVDLGAGATLGLDIHDCAITSAAAALFTGTGTVALGTRDCTVTATLLVAAATATVNLFTEQTEWTAAVLADVAAITCLDRIITCGDGGGALFAAANLDAALLMGVDTIFLTDNGPAYAWDPTVASISGRNLRIFGPAGPVITVAANEVLAANTQLMLDGVDIDFGAFTVDVAPAATFLFYARKSTVSSAAAALFINTGTVDLRAYDSVLVGVTLFTAPATATVNVISVGSLWNDATNCTAFDRDAASVVATPLVGETWQDNSAFMTFVDPVPANWLVAPPPDVNTALARIAAQLVIVGAGPIP